MAGKANTKTINFDRGVNLREAPSKEAKVIKVLPYRTKVEIEPEKEAPDGWVAVKITGYVMAEFLK